MYLHIGNNIMIDKQEIIGIFDYENLKKNKTFQTAVEKIKKEGKVEDISEGNQKTIILIKKEDKMKAYVSNISSNTLAKRKML